MKYLYWGLGILTLIAVLTYAVIQKPVQQKGEASISADKSNDLGPKASTGGVEVTLKSGVYRDYSTETVADSGYDRTIIFFYAPWCPECRSYEQVIQASDLPDGVQILKVDYDSSVDLKKKYGVTIQTTFVSVDNLGDKQKLWSGYGQSKSLDAILENTK